MDSTGHRWKCGWIWLGHEVGEQRGTYIYRSGGEYPTLKRRKCAEFRVG